MRIEIPLKLPSLNDYTKANRSNAYEGARMKRQIENDIAVFLYKMPKYEKPIRIHFHWVEKNGRRDLDNVSFGKKFILDTMVKTKRLKDDNRRYVTAFTDTFEIGDDYKVILEIEEV